MPDLRHRESLFPPPFLIFSLPGSPVKERNKNMPRKRMIDPEFWNDEELGRWSVEARLFYIGLWNFADDEGRLRAHPKLLKSQIFPYDEKINIEKLKTEISKKVRWYQVDGQDYGYIKNFLKHQIISRPTKSKIPPPPEDSPNTHGGLIEDSLNTHGGLTPNLKEVNLKEVNLKETYVDESSTPAHQKDTEFKSWCDNIITQWNEFARTTGLPAIKAIAADSKRERFLRARFKEKEFDFRKILEKVSESEFLLGLKSDWKVSFDWLICPSNYIKVLEGNYDSSHISKDTIRASRIGENRIRVEYPPGYWEKVRELQAKGLAGEDLTGALANIPEFKEFFQKQSGKTK